MGAPAGGDDNKSPIQEIVQPFIDLVRAPRALWGINIAYVLEGLVYFGMLGYLAMHFSDFVFQSVEHADEWSHNSVMVLTAGITLAMVGLGWVCDKWGVRKALILAFILLLCGRTLMAGAPNLLGLEPTRPGVQVGDKVSLHIEKMGTRNGIKSITKATVVANDAGGFDVLGKMSVDLAPGKGIEPNADLSGQLVHIGRATVGEGEKQDWAITYGEPAVEARWIVHSAEAHRICEGAKVTIDNGYVMPRLKDDEITGYVVRSHWAEDVSSVDVSGCEEVPDESSDTSADLLRTDQRAELPTDVDTSSAQATTLAELRKAEDGKVDLLLEGAYVTYVRNGGYYLQAAANGPTIFVFVNPLFSPLHLITLLGILIVVLGYGMYQPSAYAAVRQFTTPKTAAMGFAMLYALMNLGGWLVTFGFLLRDEEFAGLGIPGTYWVYVGLTGVALMVTLLILTRKTVANAIATAKEETAKIEAAADSTKDEETKKKEEEAKRKAEADKKAREGKLPGHVWIVLAACIAAAYWKLSLTGFGIVTGVIVALSIAMLVVPPVRNWISRHPLADAKFCFFIFALIPVQTLFTYNWLVLPQYIERAFVGWISDYFEIAANLNPILIFIAVPIIAAVTRKAKVYNMMILGTLIMAAPAFLLVVGPHWWTLFPYIFIMTIGEAMWQPRFLQYAAEIAPEGRTGEYMGVAQLPWFLTKMLAPLLLTGWSMSRYCPAEGEQNTRLMWLIFASIAMTSTVMLVLARNWIGKDFKTQA